MTGSESRMPGIDTASRILIVEDDYEIAELIAVYLEHEMMRPPSSVRPRRLRFISQSGKPDLVVLDLGLPGSTGLELHRHLRAASTLPVHYCVGS
jgi:DNA-binding response OmpR family regulator